MTVAELKEKLSHFDDNEEILFYYLKDNVLTNALLEDINSYGMGIEFTVQDTHEFLEENSWTHQMQENREQTKKSTLS